MRHGGTHKWVWAKTATGQCHFINFRGRGHQPCSDRRPAFVKLILEVRTKIMQLSQSQILQIMFWWLSYSSDTTRKQWCHRHCLGKATGWVWLQMPHPCLLGLTVSFTSHGHSSPLLCPDIQPGMSQLPVITCCPPLGLWCLPGPVCGCPLVAGQLMSLGCWEAGTG